MEVQNINQITKMELDSIFNYTPKYGCFNFYMENKQQANKTTEYKTLKLITSYSPDSYRDPITQ